MCVKGCSSTARFSRRTGPGRSAPSTSASSRRNDAPSHVPTARRALGQDVPVRQAPVLVQRRRLQSGECVNRARAHHASGRVERQLHLDDSGAEDRPVRSEGELLIPSTIERKGRHARNEEISLRPRRSLRAVVLIAAVTSAAYASSFAGMFVFDDGPAIADNPHIHHLWPLSTAMAAPPDSTVSGRPIVSLTLALNYALTPDLWGYHAVNLAIHVLAALTPFGIVRRTLATGVRHVSDTSLTPLALCIALLWAVHPLQTGAVTYVVQRAESLMGLFSLLTLYC